MGMLIVVVRASEGG